jgi:AraC-like DNA-binding protein
MAKRASPSLSSSEPLQGFNVLRTRDPDELRAHLAPLYAITKIELPRNKARFNAVLNHHNLQSVALSYARYGAAVRITMSNSGSYVQGFGIRGRGEAIANSQYFVVKKGRGGAAGPGADALLKYQTGFAHVFLKISPEALRRKLSVLLGSPISRELKLTGEYDQPALAAQFRLVMFVISELDRYQGDLPPRLLAEFDQALIVAYLCANLSNYSNLLNHKRPSVAASPVQRATDYIEMHWDQPITIEALALATQTSARSLFETFKRSRGCSPMAFVRYIRLLHAKDILSQGNAETSVKSVAFRCGFHNVGHFAKYYSVQFGERPSETLKRSRRR